MLEDLLKRATELALNIESSFAKHNMLLGQLAEINSLISKVKSGASVVEEVASDIQSILPEAKPEDAQR